MNPPNEPSLPSGQQSPLPVDDLTARGAPPVIAQAASLPVGKRSPLLQPLAFLLNFCLALLLVGGVVSLRECTQLLLAAPGGDIGGILGYPDDLKFRSCMTLFADVAPEEALFAAALAKFFGGERDLLTLGLLRGNVWQTGDNPAILCPCPRRAHPKSCRTPSGTIGPIPRRIWNQVAWSSAGMIRST